MILQQLLEGNLIGFITSCYTIVLGQVFYGWLALLLTAPLYIRLKSLTVMAVLWILLGSILITAMPIVSGIAVFLTIMGIGTLLFKLYQTLH